MIGAWLTGAHRTTEALVVSAASTGQRRLTAGGVLLPADQPTQVTPVVGLRANLATIRDSMCMRKGGRRRQMLLGVAFIGALGIGAAGCSSGPSTAATALCSSVSGAPPPPNFVGIVNVQTIRNGEHSGDEGLDQGAVELLKALDQHNNVGITAADSQLAAACAHLGIPVGQ
jgi:hypothetical protein